MDLAAGTCGLQSCGAALERGSKMDEMAEMS